MNARAKLVAALVASVLLLLGSIGVALTVAAPDSRVAGHHREWDRDTDGMMGRDAWSGDGPDRGAMMGPAGMMGSGWWSRDDAGAQGAGPVTADQARIAAEAWVAQYARGATVDEGVRMPMGYVFTATENERVVAIVMVDEDSGSVAGHLWATR